MKPKLLFGCYGVCVIIFFGITGMQVSADIQGNVSPFIEWISMPGSLLALWLVGVHSDNFIRASILANLAVYLITPLLFWKVFIGIKKKRAS